VLSRELDDDMTTPTNPYRVLQKQALAVQALTVATRDTAAAVRGILTAGFPDDAVKVMCSGDADEPRFVDEVLTGALFEIEAWEGAIDELDAYISRQLGELSGGLDEK